MGYSADNAVGYVMTAKRYIPSNEKYGPYSVPLDWEQGNTQLASLYEAAIQTLARTNWFKHQTLSLSQTESFVVCI